MHQILLSKVHLIVLMSRFLLFLFYYFSIETFNKFVKTDLNQMDTVNKSFEMFKTNINNLSSSITKSLNIELESGGNIRLETAKITDDTYLSCSELLLSRFNSNDILYNNLRTKLGKSINNPITGASLLPEPNSNIRICKISRIHNHYLRNRFEDALETLAQDTEMESVSNIQTSIGLVQTAPITFNRVLNVVDSFSSKFKKNLEYLFYIANEDEVQDIFINGFVDSTEIKPLSNSLSVADYKRLNKSLNTSNIPSKGYLVIVKAYSGKSSMIDQKRFISTKMDAVVNFEDDLPPVIDTNYPKLDSVYEVSSFLYFRLI